MRKQRISIITAAVILLSFTAINTGFAQNSTITLQQAIDLALENNHLLNIKKLQVEEKTSKVTEGRIKAFPIVTLNSTYQYNQNLGKLTIPQGSLGTLPLSPQMIISMPNEDLDFVLSEHHSFNAGATLYQPITQLGKIKKGVDVAKTEVKIAREEEVKASLQIEQAVEKLYYGLLINQKQHDESEAKLELAKMKMHDVEVALLSGKTIDVNKAGLMANIADEEQNLLKWEIQAEDYWADLGNLTGIKTDSVSLVNADALVSELNLLVVEEKQSEFHNPDLVIAELNQQRARQGLSAARWSYLPDLGLVAGYTYQMGNKLYPEHNPFVGANLKWNLQDIITNTQIVNQRNFLLEQAVENLENTQKQVNSDIEKANRKIRQAIALVNVAQKAVTYRNEELKIQQDKKASGLNIETDLLNTKSQLAKAQADLLSAQLNYRISRTDLRVLKGE